MNAIAEHPAIANADAGAPRGTAAIAAALQRVRNRVGGSRRNNATALDVFAIAEAALKYEA